MDKIENSRSEFQDFQIETTFLVHNRLGVNNHCKHSKTNALARWGHLHRARIKKNHRHGVCISQIEVWSCSHLRSWFSKIRRRYFTQALHPRKPFQNTRAERFAARYNPFCTHVYSKVNRETSFSEKSYLRARRNLIPFKNLGFQNPVLGVFWV